MGYVFSELCKKNNEEGTEVNEKPNTRKLRRRSRKRKGQAGQSNGDGHDNEGNFQAGFSEINQVLINNTFCVNPVFNIK